MDHYHAMGCLDIKDRPIYSKRSTQSCNHLLTSHAIADDCKHRGSIDAEPLAAAAAAAAAAAGLCRMESYIYLYMKGSLAAEWELDVVRLGGDSLYDILRKLKMSHLRAIIAEDLSLSGIKHITGASKAGLLRR